MFKKLLDTYILICDLFLTQLTTTLHIQEKERGAKMAMPIAPTPILRGREAKKFDLRIEEDLKTPTSIIATPRLENAKLLLRKNAVRQ